MQFTEVGKTQLKYRPEVDGLRTLAVLPVILFHAGVGGFGGGFVGVDIFFVISGYLITTIIASELEQCTFSIVNFYERRARRILPALFLVMAVCLPAAWLLLLPSDMMRFSNSLVAVPTFLSNLLFWQESGYFDSAAETKPLLHTWSLAVEEQFYLLFPVLLYFVWRWGKSAVWLFLIVVMGVSLAVAQWAAFNKPTAGFFLLPTRAWELGLGAASALWLMHSQPAAFKLPLRQMLSIAGALLIAFSISWIDESTPFPSVYALMPTLGAMLIILFAKPDTWVGRILGARMFVGIGLLSYSAYLWHQPLFAFARHISYQRPGQGVFALLCLATFALAYLSWRYIEQPFRDKKLITKSGVFTFAVAGSLIFVCIGLLGIKMNGFGGRFSPEIQRVEAVNGAVFEASVKNCWDAITYHADISSGCLLGKPGTLASFALTGDSHAGSLLSAIDALAANSGTSGVSYTYRSCPPLMRGATLTYSENDRICTALRRSIFSTLNTGQQPGTVVLSARWSLLMEKKRFNNEEGAREPGVDWVWGESRMSEEAYRAAMAANMADSVRAFLDSGHQVILVYPIPEAGWSVPQQLSKKYRIHGSLQPADASTAHAVFQQRNRAAIAALDAIGQHPRLSRVYPEKIFCDSYVKQRCITHLNGVPLYVDDNHLSEAGARLVVSSFIGELTGTSAIFP